jgi:hypothetical protein
MLSRTYHRAYGPSSSTIGRAASIRRMRRRSMATTRLYCQTNGCTSFLEVHPEGGIAVCPVCAYTRRLN